MDLQEDVLRERRSEGVTEEIVDGVVIKEEAIARDNTMMVEHFLIRNCVNNSVYDRN
jgi:hypothetical protein